MEIWFLLIVSLCVAALIRALLFHFHRRDNTKKLPPGPSFLSSIFIILTTSLPELEQTLINLKSKHGPFLTLFTGPPPSIIVSSHSIAHHILIQKGAVFSDRPPALLIRNIASASYGPTWRLLRRNLASEILHPSRVTSYSWGRKWALHSLINRLQEDKQVDEVVDHFRYAMFCLLVAMCFGEKVEESEMNEIVRVMRHMLLRFGSGRFNVLSYYPKMGKILFRNRWKEFLKMRSDQQQLLMPLIKSRIKAHHHGDNSESPPGIVAYVDTLVDLQLPEEEGKIGKLSEKEMVSMCGEFLNAGTDTTSTALQWIMANLVKQPEIQRKLFDEIVSVVGPPPPPPPPGVELEFVINEEELKKMGYLKAVVLEALRRHPPGHFVLPHRATKEVEVEGFTIPEGATLNFMVGEMGLDPKVWDDPMEFKPERFLVNDSSYGVFDISGSKGIKMMPFGAGRRICPGLDFALLHLEYFVANLIWYFHWTTPADDGYEVDLSEKLEFTVVMKNSLKTQISTRAEKSS